MKEDDARALLAGIIPGRLDQPVRDRIIGETRGNPLALLELSRGISAAQLAGGFGLPTAANLPAQIEDHYLGRVRALPEPTQHLMLLAAADPVGDASLLWRAAQSLGIEPWAAEPAEADQLLEIRASGAVSPSAGEISGLPRRVDDRSAGRSRRPGHRHRPRGRSRSAGLASSPRGQWPGRRGGRRVTPSGQRGRAPWRDRRGRRVLGMGGQCSPLTPGRERGGRSLPAGAKFEAGDFPAAESLLATADAGPLDELGRAQVERMRAQIAFDLRRGSDAPGAASPCRPTA